MENPNLRQFNLPGKMGDSHVLLLALTGSMYDVYVYTFTHIWLIFMVNVGK